MISADLKLVEDIALLLVERSEYVAVGSDITRELDGDQTITVELRVHPKDLGVVIGRGGKTAQAIRNLLKAYGVKNGRTSYNFKVVRNENVKR